MKLQITLTEEELKALFYFLDVGVRNEGLRVAPDAVALAEILRSARPVEETPPEETNDGE